MHQRIQLRFTILLAVTVLFTVIAAILKLQYAPMAEFFIESALCLMGVFIALCVVDIIREKNLNTAEKWLYALLVICFPLLGGILYILRPQRKRFSDKFDEI